MLSADVSCKMESIGTTGVRHPADVHTLYFMKVNMTSVWGSLKVRSLISTDSTVQLAKIVMMSQRSMLCHRYLLPMECTATAGKVKAKWLDD